jgi:CHASE2 domain-containing sensor protein
MKNWINIDNLVATLLVFAMLFIFPIMFSFDFLRPVRDSLADFELTDIYFSSIRGEESVEADENIVIINSSGLSEKGFAKLLQEVTHAEPKVIGITHDMSFEEEKVQDFIFEIFLENDNVFSLKSYDYLYRYEDHLGVDTITSVRGSWGNFSESFSCGLDYEHATCRKYYPIPATGSGPSTFSTIIATIFDADIYQSLYERWHDKSFMNKYELIYYRGGINKFYHLEAIDILKGDQDIEFIMDKIVLIGKAGIVTDHIELDDVYYTPLNKQYLGKAFPDMYGTVVQANIISMIINENYIDSMSIFLELLLAFFVCYFNMAIFKIMVKRLPTMYEFLSLAVFVLESVLLLYLTILLMAKFNYEFKSTMAIFTSALSVIMFEMYTTSIKPLSLRAWKKYRKLSK